MLEYFLPRNASNRIENWNSDWIFEIARGEIYAYLEAERGREERRSLKSSRRTRWSLHSRTKTTCLSSNKSPIQSVEESARKSRWRKFRIYVRRDSLGTIVRRYPKGEGGKTRAGSRVLPLFFICQRYLPLFTFESSLLSPSPFKTVEETYVSRDEANICKDAWEILQGSQLLNKRRSMAIEAVQSVAPARIFRGVTLPSLVFHAREPQFRNFFLLLSLVCGRATWRFIAEGVKPISRRKPAWLAIYSQIPRTSLGRRVWRSFRRRGRRVCEHSSRNINATEIKNTRPGLIRKWWETTLSTGITRDCLDYVSWFSSTAVTFISHSIFIRILVT